MEREKEEKKERKRGGKQKIKYSQIILEVCKSKGLFLLLQKE